MKLFWAAILFIINLYVQALCGMLIIITTIDNFVPGFDLWGSQNDAQALNPIIQIVCATCLVYSIIENDKRFKKMWRS